MTDPWQASVCKQAVQESWKMSLTMVMTIFGLRLYLHPQNFCLFTSQSILQSYNFLMEVILGNHYQAMGCHVDRSTLLTSGSSWLTSIYITGQQCFFILFYLKSSELLFHDMRVLWKSWWGEKGWNAAHPHYPHCAPTQTPGPLLVVRGLFLRFLTPILGHSFSHWPAGIFSQGHLARYGFWEGPHNKKKN